MQHRFNIDRGNGYGKTSSKIQLNRIQVSERLLFLVSMLVIAVLCLYIGVKSVSLMTDATTQEDIAVVARDTSQMIASEIVENSSIITQYMLYVENHENITEEIKKNLLSAVITDYIQHSEYTYDTSDPAYEDVINMIYENINTGKATKKYVKNDNNNIYSENNDFQNQGDENNVTQESVNKDEKNDDSKKTDKNNNEEKNKTNNDEKTKTDNKEEIKDDHKNKTKSVATSGKIWVPIPKVSGTIYTEKKIGSFKNMIEKFYTVTSATSVYEKDIPINKALDKQFKIKGNNRKPQILIYHTHSQEEFYNSTKDTDTTIIGVGNRLTKVLKEQFGYNVIHDKTKYDMVNGKLDRNEAYDQARTGVKKILKDNPTISLVLDIHRDGLNDNIHLVTNINGKKTAKIMFFNGMSRFKTTGDIGYLYNPYLFENLALSLQMKLKAEAYYPGFTRRNYVNAYKYNLDLCKQCMLIEVGAQTNSYQEAKNAAEPLAVLINMVMGK